MIYTVTFNPSLDYVMRVKGFEANGVNRTYEDFIVAGGKGVNVSIMLRHLGHENTALGFIAGFTGDEIVRQLREEGCHESFVRLEKGYSRINVKLKSNGETEINAQGPVITDTAMSQLYKQLDALKNSDTLVLSGSIPKGLPETTYRDIMERLKGRDIRIIVDATQDLLMNVLDLKPFLIKPNHHELESVFNTKFTTESDIIDAARQLQAKGAQNVLVSRAGDGAVLVDANGDVRTSAVTKGKLVNSVGSGDSMVAGFLAGYIESDGQYDKALAMGVAAGSASAFEEWLANREQVEALLEKE